MNRFGLPLLFCTLLTAFGAVPLRFAPAPNDTYWNQQWYLENLGTNALRVGIDVNVRTAWAQSLGEGVTIAIVDDGVDLNHPELIDRARSELHWNFASGAPNGNHPTDAQMHGTAVAGLAVAEANNERGMAGLAPKANFASWVIFKTNNVGGPFVGTNDLAAMFRFHSQEVQVQNHSWVTPNGEALVTMSAAEDQAIGEATTTGRQGRGVIMVRAGGNDRIQGRNANDDAYILDTRTIAVAALNPDGVVSSYSTPGAPLLVAAPGGELGVATLFTTDRVGNKGYNRIGFTNDLADYAFDSLGFTGTSAAAPLVSGTVALMLARNPALTVRDVQQILLLSAYQTNPNDTDVQRTGPGLLVSHNSGYGLISAGTAVDLASRWTNRPPAVSTRAVAEQEIDIPDAGLTLAIQPAGGSSPNLLITALPSLGLHIDKSSDNVRLVYVGDGSEPLDDLTGKAALIQRGNLTFSEKIANAAKAGALFAVIFNNTGANALQLMGGTDYAPIPAVFISQQDGETLTNLLGQSAAFAQIRFDTADYDFQVSDSLLCEHVKVTVEATHEQRGDLRITLVSPVGTRSVLQRLGRDLSPFPKQWTFTSTHHFYESSQGTWHLQIGDESAGGTGTVHRATLEILGVPIKDADHDGLDDDWEMAHFNSLQYGPMDDPDQDGYSNAREQILGTDPAANESPLAVGLSFWDDSVVRLNWPSRAGAVYQIVGKTNLNAPLSIFGEISGGFPRTTWFQKAGAPFQCFIIREKPQ